MKGPEQNKFEAWMASQAGLVGIRITPTLREGLTKEGYCRELNAFIREVGGR